MTKEERASDLYKSSKHLKYGGLVAAVMMWIISAVHFHLGVPVLGYTYIICSIMFLCLYAVGTSTMKWLERREPYLNKRNGD